MLARARGAARQGVEARLVDVEADASDRGTFKVFLVGLSPTAARGMERRLLTSLRNTGLPTGLGVLTVNFAPAALPKEGPPLDLAVAAAVLGSQGIVPHQALDSTLFHGELSLDGRIRPAPGALAAAECAKASGLTRMLCASEVAGEAAAVEGIAIHAVRGLIEMVALLKGGPADTVATPTSAVLALRAGHAEPDLADVQGQATARRALEVAAAGGHGLLLVGPPGSGKSMLARRLPSLLPPLTLAEAVEVTRIHSAAGLLLTGSAPGAVRDIGGGLLTRRPFRAPHHGVSMAGLLGGGSIPGPGEITLAHRGVLFLDEIAEFRRDVLEALRQPLEDGVVSIVRVGGRILLPCRFMPCCAMNPCPCGWAGSTRQACRCSDGAVARYRARLSGPLLDRLDLHVDVPALSFAEIHGGKRGETSAVVRERVLAARDVQAQRQGSNNASLRPAELRRMVRLSESAKSLMQVAVDRLGLSGRAHDRVLQVALTVRDLGHPAIKTPVLLDAGEIAEALAYRRIDRQAPRLAPEATA